MKGFVLAMLLGAFIFLLLVSCRVEVYTVTVDDPSATPAVELNPLPGPRTAPEAHWIAKVNGECARRNARALGLRPPGTPSELARYSRRLFTIYREHLTRALAVRRPASLTAEAQMFRDVEMAKLRALDRVRRSAGSLDVPGAKQEIRRFEAIARDGTRGLVELGVPQCARYE
jgi:hypothetical protein